MAIGKFDGIEDFTIIVTDRHRIRSLNLTSEKVKTIAGTGNEGKADGQVNSLLKYH